MSKKIGIVVGSNCNKTITVLVKRRVMHDLYKKVITKESKFLVHDEKNECKNGDKVQIKESRPISKRKRWCFDKKIV